MEHYSNFQRIGEGSYGEVYKAQDEKGRLVAVKKCRFKNADGVPAVALREISLLQKLSRCDHVVRLHAVHPSREGCDLVLHLVLEFLDYDLKQFIDMAKRQLSPHHIKVISYQILRAVLYCHERGIVHRDIKPQNVLLKDSQPLPTVKLADFGLARPYTIEKKTYTHEVLTLWYRAPEILLGDDEYTTAIDIWSVGCIVAEMANKSPLFPGSCEFDQLLKVFQMTGTPNKQLWPGVASLKYWHEFPNWPPRAIGSIIHGFDPSLLDLLDKMLKLDPKHRITAREALQHPYFYDIQLHSNQVSATGSRMEACGNSGARKIRKARREHR